jgi:hypothetical protein
MRNILFMAVLAAGFAGCVGGIDSPNGSDGSGGGSSGGSGGGGGSSDGSSGGSSGGPTADPTSDLGKKSKELFDKNVYPAISANCLTACHGQAAPMAGAPGFVATDPARGYLLAAGDPQLVGDLKPATAKIMIYGVSGHKGAPYNADQVTKITEWLAAETAARAGGSGGVDPNSPAAKRAKIENDFAKCMSITNFTTANMAVWAVVNSNDNNNNATCQSCHNFGQYNFAANGVPATGFGIISSEVVVMRQYFAIDSADAPTKMIVNTTNLTSVANGTDGHIGHRRFNLTNNNGLAAMNALNAFYASTTAAVAAGNCAGAGLKNFIQ